MIAGRQGILRLLAYRNTADMGSYKEAIDGFLAGRDPIPSIVVGIASRAARNAASASTSSRS